MSLVSTIPPYYRPQWSPPLIGGNTRDLRESLVEILKAAMEPAVDRREHSFSTCLEQYEDPPQWSPPLIGGNTTLSASLAVAGPLPQWSPPLIGGNTRRQQPGSRGQRPGRNGARR